MPERNVLPSLIKILFAFGLVLLSTLLIENLQGTAKVSVPATHIPDQSELRNSFPFELLTALTEAHGSYERLLSEEQLVRDLQGRDIVLIGEAHYDRKDMQTAFEIVRLLSQRRSIALAVERFPLTFQADLQALNGVANKNLRYKGMESILQADDYQIVWGTNEAGQSGFNSPGQPHYPLNSPSAEVFEAMMLWAACERIPVIGMDLPFSERDYGRGENIPYRNDLWKNEIANFLENNRSENYLVIAIGGINHFSNGPDSVQAKLRETRPSSNFLSIGQRDANYPSRESRQVEQLVSVNQVDDLILQSPQYAVIKQDGSARFPTPPDYWIAAHAVDGWENPAACSQN